MPYERSTSEYLQDLGREAAAKGLPESYNPYKGTVYADAWRRGWRAFQAELCEECRQEGENS